MNIKIFYDQIKFRLKSGKEIKNLVEKIISAERKSAGDINIIITDDKTLREINIEFLKHNYFTDVISFRSNSGKIVNGEVYLSIDRVKINSINYNVSLNREITRVIIHGILHLCEYDDKTEREKTVMTVKEDKWLDYFFRAWRYV